MDDYTFGSWEDMCHRIGKQISEEILRVAVVGPIKSGKSTFVNALLSGDYLKRGAGVVTSIVTRIRRGKKLGATLYFKSWDDINADIEQAMTFFPAKDWRSESTPFDIRSRKDRSDLKRALDGLGSDLVMESGTLNANWVLASHYLTGFDSVKGIVESGTGQVVFTDEKFGEHKAFVGNDSFSVYLKDIQLDIDSAILRNNVEIADCQGSDSPNPLHLAMIQDYLVVAHLIIYVISSRTGLREADIRFLSMIKKMGIIDNILFIVNCDFNEHESLDDLNDLVKTVKQELSLIKPSPTLFTFSSLFSLFTSRGMSLSEKDAHRLSQWENATSFVRASVEERALFLKEFDRQIVHDRLSLLLKNHLERLGVMAAGIGNWTEINQEALGGDLESARQFIEKIKHHEEKIDRIKRLVKDTMDGAVGKLIEELKREVDRFFSRQPENVLEMVLDFVRNYRVTLEDYEEKLENTGFNNALYHLFQDVKQNVDLFMAESVNPRLIKFIKEKESHISEFLTSVASPYEGMVLDAIFDYNETVKNFGVTPVFMERTQVPPPDMDDVKNMTHVALPPARATMRYSGKIKTDANLRFGAYSAVKLIKKLFKKPIQNEREYALRALGDSVSLIKRETEKSIVEQFKNLRENIKFQYLLKLANGASNVIFQELGNRFQTYQTDLSRLSSLLDDKGADKENAMMILNEAKAGTDEILAGIDQARQLIGKTS